jgi:hypothetical protein
MTTERSQYLAYLLRLWQAGSGKESPWRASLEDARTAERQNFATLEDLFTFLREQTDTWSSIPAEKGGTR